MKSISYEREADASKHFYFMDFPDMKAVNYVFRGFNLHKSVEMVVCYKGEISYKCGDKTGKLHRGDILIINSFDYHFYEYVKNASIFILVLSSEYVDDVLGSKNKEFNNIIHVNENTISKIEQLLSENFQKFDTLSFVGKKAFVLDLFSRLEKFDLLRDKEETFDKEICKDIITYIENHYKEKITIESVGLEFGYSKNYFSHMFNRIMGENFNSFLNRYRLSKANELKKENLQYSMEEIIYLVGFSSRETYYRALRKENL